MPPTLGLRIDVPDQRIENISETGTLKGGSILINPLGIRVEEPAKADESPSERRLRPVSAGSMYLKPSSAPFVVHYRHLTDLGSLGDGGHGTVRKALHEPTGQVIAVKELLLDVSSDTARTNTEREILQYYRLDHPAVIPCYGAWFRQGKVFFALEYCSLGSLADLLTHFGSFPESVLKGISYQLIDALAYLKREHVIHRDIKPPNVLAREDGSVLLCDFGVSALDVSTMPDAHTWKGTAPYMSPECIMNNSYNWSADLWSLGITLLELFRGEYPYPVSEASLFEILDTINSQEPPIPSPTEVSPEMISFFALILDKDPTARPEPTSLLTHPWFTPTCVCEAKEWIVSQASLHNLA